MGNRKQVRKTNVEDVLFYNMRTVVDPDGNLVPIESNQDSPFPIRRIFYVYGVGDRGVRGKHAHFKTKQLLICVHGKVEVMVSDGEREKKFLLESPQQGLYIPEMIWDEQVYKDDDSILLVLSNTKYDPDDYIHNMNEFKKLKRGE